MNNTIENTINKHISVNDILLKLRKNPMSKDEFLSIQRYFNSLYDANLISVISTSHYYDKDLYDFYFIIEDSSKNWAKKLILKRSMVDLIIKYRVIEFLIILEYKHHNLELLAHD